MKRRMLYALALLLVITACSGESNDKQIDSESNQIQNEAVSEDATDLPYILGPDTDAALKDMYGEDSVGADGNYVYPPRDTIWLK